jgi:hypothetical protein
MIETFNNLPLWESPRDSIDWFRDVWGPGGGLNVTAEEPCATEIIGCSCGGQFLRSTDFVLRLLCELISTVDVLNSVFSREVD